MDEKETVREAQQRKKRRGGRKPYTPAQKTSAAKAREEAKRKEDSFAPDVLIQYQGSEANVVALIAPAKAEFRSVKKRTRITEPKKIMPEQFSPWNGKRARSGADGSGVPFRPSGLAEASHCAINTVTVILKIAINIL